MMGPGRGPLWQLRGQCRPARGRLGGTRPATAVSAPRRRRVADPLAIASALDVFAVCLSAGMAVSAAASITASNAPAPLAVVLQRAADLLALPSGGASAEPSGSRAGGRPDN